MILVRDLVRELSRDLANKLILSEFLPTNISNILLWLDGDDVDTITFATASTRVQQWDDKSGNVHDFIQVTDFRQPAYVTNVQNGRNILRGDGINDFLGRLGPGIATYGPDISIFVVCTPTTGTEDYIFGDAGAPSSAPAFITGFNSLDYEMFGPTPRFTFAASASGFNILTLLHNDGGSDQGYFNGSKIFDASAVSSFNGNMFDIIFSANGTVAFAAIDIAEIIIYNKKLVTSERQSVHKYLSPKWGIPLLA